MIIHEEHPIKIFTKKDNLYIYNFSKPFRAETTKIIIKKYKFLRKNEEDDDYWEFIINKIVKLSSDWKKLTLYLKHYRFDNCKKVKIFSKNNKFDLKMQLFKRNIIFIFNGHNYLPIDIKKLKENQKLYKKFENRYCYSMNYNKPDSDTYSDYQQAHLWFQWFSIKYPEYFLTNIDRNKYDITVGSCYIKDNLTDEPKMDYDYFDLFW